MLSFALIFSRNQLGYAVHIVLLLGSSTAGKSSLCRELVTEHHWNSGSVDESCDKIQRERAEKLNPLMLLELKNKNLITQLQSLMSEDDVLNLANTGMLSITIGAHQFSHQFNNPDLEELEEILKNEGINESDINDLASTLRLVTKVGDDFYKAYPFPDPMERLYDETFNKNNAGKSIVLDVVPNPNGGAKELIDHFNQRATLYREQNPTETLTTSVVFAYCPPQELSERILERNRKAEIADPRDKRVGLFPFYQLATLVTADMQYDSCSENTLSRNELFYMISRHANTDKIGDPLFLENPFDPEALQQNYIESPQVTITESGEFKLQPPSEELELATCSSSDMPRIGSKKTILEYGHLASKFGFFENQQKVSLNIPAGISFDAVVNTAKGTPASLAIEFIESLQKGEVCMTI